MSKEFIELVNRYGAAVKDMAESEDDDGDDATTIWKQIGREDAARDAREAELRALAGELATVLNECANGIQSVPSANAAIDAALAKARAAGLLPKTANKETTP